MKRLLVIPVVMVAACSSGPSKQDSVQIFATASSAMTVAQSDAVAQAGGGTGELALDFTSPCTSGGTIAVKGSYVGDGSENATFDLTTSFNSCRQIGGYLDGEIQWTSQSSATGFIGAMTGDLDWEGNNGSGACSFAVHITVSNSLVSYNGTICGYNIGTDLTLTGH